MNAPADGHVPLADLLERLEASHEIESVQSRTAAMLIARPRPGVDARTLLVKHCERRYVPSAEAAYNAHVRCDAVGRRDNTPLVPTPECWGSDPPYICIELVTSRSVGTTLTQLLSTGVESDANQALAMTARAGATLARFHRALPITEAAQEERLTSPKLHRIARRLVGSPRETTAPRVHLHTDFAPHNLILTDPDEMLVVDLPGSDRVGVPEEDLGRLVDSMFRRALARSPALGDALVDAALTGYESESKVIVRTGDRRALVESFALRHALLMVLDGVRRRSRARIRTGLRAIVAARRRARANR